MRRQRRSSGRHRRTGFAPWTPQSACEDDHQRAAKKRHRSRTRESSAPPHGRRAEPPWIGLRGYLLRRAFAVSDLVALGCALGRPTPSSARRTPPCDRRRVAGGALPAVVGTDRHHHRPVSPRLGRRGLRGQHSGRSGPRCSGPHWLSLVPASRLAGGALRLPRTASAGCDLGAGDPARDWVPALTRYLVRTSGWYTQAAVLVGRPVDPGEAAVPDRAPFRVGHQGRRAVR